MSMSVGLGKIQNDPKATPLTRKALGALSTPHLLVDNQGISVDDEGRLFVRVKPGGGILLNDETGLYLEETFGVDSHVNVDDDATGNREWNMRITGTAPNYIEDNIYIGANDLRAELAELTAIASSVDDAKVQIYSQHTQLRLFWDKTSWLSVKTFPGGGTEFYSCGPDATECGFNFITTSGSSVSSGFNPGNDSGIAINGGDQITQIFTLRVQLSHTGGGVAGGTAYEEFWVAFTPGTARDDRDVVFACPLDGAILPAEIMNWSAYINYLGQLQLRVSWINVLAPFAQYWKFVVIKFKNP